jgi:hypothetical protein
MSNESRKTQKLQILLFHLQSVLNKQNSSVVKKTIIVPLIYRQELIRRESTMRMFSGVIKIFYALVEV